MLPRIIIILSIVAIGYSAFEMYRFKSMYRTLRTPQADFQITGDTKSDLTIVEFVDYNCSHCRTISPILEKALEIEPHTRLVIRPLAYMEGSEKLASLVLAAGKQNKFLELHKAFINNTNGEFDDGFIRRAVEGNGIDYKKLVEDAKSEEIKKLVAENMNAARKGGIYSIPSFLIGTTFLEPEDKMPTVADFLKVISESR